MSIDYYQAPVGHTVLWTAMGMGSVLVPVELQQGELVAFTPSNEAVEFEAKSEIWTSLIQQGRR